MPLGDNSGPNLGPNSNVNLGPNTGLETNPGPNPEPEHCQPLECDKAMNCIEGARNPTVSPLEMGQLRSQLTDCAPCLSAFDLEVKLRATMAPAVSELPSFDFRSRITETLASVDLSKLDITDF